MSGLDVICLFFILSLLLQQDLINHVRPCSKLQAITFIVIPTAQRRRALISLTKHISPG